jgi:hypothetical protein
MLLLCKTQRLFHYIDWSSFLRRLKSPFESYVPYRTESAHNQIDTNEIWIDHKCFVFVLSNKDVTAKGSGLHD